MSAEAPITTVFLDRDGVINRRLPGDYVKSWDEFEFLPGVVDALAALRAAGLCTVVVTNQRGVARGIMPIEAVEAVHDRMQRELRERDAHVDAVYLCPDMDGPMRKPAPGMLLAAARDHERVDLGRAIIVGDSVTDLQAGHAAGVRGLLIAGGDDRDEKLDALEALGVPVEHAAGSLKEALDECDTLRDACGPRTSGARGKLSRCPICASRRLNAFQDLDAGRLRICVECRHIAWDRTPDTDELAEYYRTTYTETHGQQELQDSARAYYRSHLESLLSRAGCEPERTTLIDYGSSYPTLLEEARALGIRRPIGIEPDAGARDRAAEIGIEMHAPETLDEAVSDESVQIVRFSHVLEHLTDPLEALRDVVRKVAEGGLVYITQPSFPLLAPARFDEPLRDCVWPEHLHYFNALSLRVLAERAGLTVAGAFTHQNADEAVRAFAPALDLAYASDRLRDVADLGDPAHGRLANYPAYAGENSTYFLTVCR